MCIIAIKPAGVQFPADTTLSTMWINNPDGAGFMYPSKGKVCIRKGFMNYDSFMDAIDTLKKSSADLVNMPIVFHFRITTHGGTKPENCHPFAITDNVAILQKPLIYTDVGVAHNGIIDIVPREDISDTMEYVVSQLSVIKAINRKFYEQKRFLQLIENAIKSKMVFLAGDGTVAKVGEFVTDDDGMIYSNTSYIPRVSYSKYDYSLPYGYCYGYDGYVYKDQTDLSGSDVKALMLLSDADAKRPIHTKNGGLIDLDCYAIDKKGRLYRIDYDTGCAYRDGSVSLADKVRFDTNKADHYTTYPTYKDMISDVYGVEGGWTIPDDTYPSTGTPWDEWDE